MNYYSLGDYSINKNREDNIMLESKLRELKEEYEGIIKNPNFKRALYKDSKGYSKILFELETNMLITSYKIEINKILARLSISNIDHKSDEKKLSHYNNALLNINEIINNPFVNGNIDKILSDTKNINILKEFINIIKRLRANDLDNDILEVLNISSNLIKDCNILIGNIRANLNNQINSLKVSTNQRFIQREEELNLFLKGVNRVLLDNKSYSSAYKDAQNEINKLNEVNKLKKRLDKVPKNINISTSVINSNIPTIELLDIARRIEIIIGKLLARLPKEKKYGLYTLNYQSIIESCNNILNMLSPIKENNLIKLNRSGYYSEIGKLNSFDEKQKLTKSLSKRYEKLLGNIGDEERAKVEGEIHKIISGSNLSKNERNTIKMKAKNIAKLNKNSINVSELHKFKNFKNTPSKKNFIDLNSSNIYNINNNLNSLEMEIDIPNQEEDLNNEMLSLSCEMLYSNGMINNSELGSLSETDKQKVIDYTKTLKEYSSLPEEEVARRMVLEPWVDPSGNLNRRDDVTPADIIAQMNINRMHNLMNRLSVFKENTNSDNEGKII